jgi:tetratricopeptide (TPR) repeat protein
LAKTLAVFVALSIALSPILAVAQTVESLSTEQRELLGRLFTDARTAYEAHDYPASIARLEEAYALFPEPNILYRIAEMNEELGEREQALKAYTKFLVEKPDASNAVVVQTRIERLRAEREAAQPKTARLTIDSIPQGAVVYLSGIERQGVTPLEIEVLPGSHDIRLELQGYEGSSRTIGVAAGDLRTFDFRLSSTEVVVVEEASVAPWVLGGLGVSSGIASAVFFLVASDRQDTLDAWDAARQGSARPAEYDQVLDQERTYRVMGWAAAGAAAACLVGAGVWWWVDDSGTAVTIGPASVQVVASF